MIALCRRGPISARVEAVAEEANRCQMFYVNQRWLGGLLTNMVTVQRSIKRLKDLDEMAADNAYEGRAKKEIGRLERERKHLQQNLAGIKDMSGLPDLMFVIDSNKEAIAVKEARKLGIPVVAVVDTNCDPDEVQYPIPGNDDAIRSVGLLTRIIADAAAEGLIQRHAKPEEGKEVEPLAAWEAELLAASETPTTEAEKIEAVDEAVSPVSSKEEIAEEIAAVVAEEPTEENDADAVVAEHAAEADPELVVEHHVESDEEAEAKIEAEATDEEKTPKKAAAAKPAAATK